MLRVEESELVAGDAVLESTLQVLHLCLVLYLTLFGVELKSLDLTLSKSLLLDGHCVAAVTARVIKVMT